MRRKANLLERWRKQSVGGVWSDAPSWWTPAVETVADVLAGQIGIDVVEASTVLGSERAAVGVFLDEARADLLVGAKIARAKPDRVAQLVYGLTAGWVDRTLEDLYVADCVDPLTELCSPSYLAVRLGELYDDAELRNWSVAERHKLLIVQVDRAVHRLDGETRLILIQTSMRSSFRGGETLARVAPTRAVALVHQEPELSDHLARLGAQLDLACAEGRLPGFRMWIESLPPSRDGVRPLLRTLSID